MSRILERLEQDWWVPKNICYLGGGGGSPAPQESTSTVHQSSLPEYAEPYFTDLMERAQGLTQEDYQPYGGPRIGETSPFTQGSYDATQAVAGSTLPYIQEAMNTTGMIGANVLGGLPTLDPSSISGLIPQILAAQAQYPGDANYGGPMTGPGNVSYDGSINTQMVGAGQFPDAQLDQYMNPYTGSVVRDTNDELWRQNMQQQAAIRDRMANSGSYGGSRQGVLESEQDRNYLNTAARTANTLYDQSYQQAQAQINADQNRMLQADMSNQQADLQGGLAQFQGGLTAGLANQQYGYQTGATNLNAALQAAMQNQGIQGQMSLSDQDAIMQAQQLNQGSTLAGLTSDQQADLQAQLGDLNSFLDANQMGLSAAGQLGGLSDLYQNVGLTGATAIGQAGADEELYRQALYDTAYGDFANQRDFPYQQLSRYSSYLQGVPIGMSSEVSQYQNPYAQLLGLGIGGLGLYNALNR